MKFDELFEKAFADCQGDSAFRMDRDRPYNGQPHTNSGIRGETLVEGLTMRDISDCMVRGFLDSAGIYTENPIRDDVFKIDCDIDPVAVMQNTTCYIEKMMGIYPNVPELTEE